MQYVFGYPCDTSNDCTPYSVILSPGTYKFEAWGSSGSNYISIGTPGLGGYTSGILHSSRILQIYLFVGAVNNGYNYMTNNGIKFSRGGASSDIRLNVSSNFDWYDKVSLRSRIMVAAGGGSAEWKYSIGGNAGGLTGQDGVSDCRYALPTCSNIQTLGANQTSGGYASKTNIWYPGTSNQFQGTGIDGTFGRIPDFGSNIDIGGMGGNGYYSGATLIYSGAGGGGSSFISGHKGCIALNSSLNENPSPTQSNIHYSGIYFTQTKMIGGNETMPLYFSSTSEGRGNEYNGCIRITILSSLCSCLPQYFIRSYYIFSLLFILFDS